MKGSHDVRWRALRRELGALDDGVRRRLAQALEAASQLGCWIELLRGALEEAAGTDLDAVPDGLAVPAGEEWRRARRTLEGFAARDAPAFRRLGRALREEAVDPAPEEARFLAASGLLDEDPPFAERLQRYLEPFDHPGRLGELTLALQYLTEAYPIEQLEIGRRTRLRRGLAEAVASVRLEEDFHHLVARIAAGIGLDYRPVPYYRSRLDESRHAFVRQQVSPISLTERVGFAAAADPSVIVRLARPFFFSSANHVYYSGHAHVARG